MVLGVQIYGCMKEFRADPEGFCTRLQKAGYTQIEPCVSLSADAETIAKNGMNPVWQPEEVPDFASLLRKHGLTLSSCHIFGDPKLDADKAAKLAAENGISEIVVNCPACDTLEACHAFADKCVYLAEKLRAVNASLWIHNGWPEIRRKFGDKTALEVVLERCGGAVGTQIDVGWVLYGGEDPTALMARVLPYLRSVHYKDIKVGYENMPLDTIHTALGNGALDWRASQKFAREHGIPELIDQDMSDGDFLLDLERSAELLR